MEPVPDVAPAPAPPPAPFLYAVPWQLRPLPAPTVLRWDNSVGLDEDRASRGGRTWVSLLTASVRIPGTGPARAGLAAVARLGFVSDAAPVGPSAVVVSNALLGLAYASKLPEGFGTNVFLGTTLPVGSGGGDEAAPEAMGARTRAAAVRFGFDNPLLSTNDLGVVGGASLGWVAHGWTLQAEVTVSYVGRVRGASLQREASKTNSGVGVHVGTFVLPFLSLNGELRHQRWLDGPFSVVRDSTGASVDTTSFTVGPRLHLPVGSVWVRPGLAYARALDRPLAGATPNLHVVQVDVPVFF